MGRLGFAAGAGSRGPEWEVEVSELLPAPQQVSASRVSSSSSSPARTMAGDPGQRPPAPPLSSPHLQPPGYSGCSEASLHSFPSGPRPLSRPTKTVHSWNGIHPSWPWKIQYQRAGLFPFIYQEERKGNTTLTFFNSQNQLSVNRSGKRVHSPLPTPPHPPPPPWTSFLPRGLSQREE